MLSSWTRRYLAANASRIRRAFTACLHPGCTVCRHLVLLSCLWLSTRYRYFGVIQAGYREVLQTMSISDEVDLTTVTRAATEAPSTPRSHTRNRSFGTAPLPGSTTRLNNSFMTVPPNHAPTSPSHGVLKNKRNRDISTERSVDSLKKKRGD